MLEEGSPQPCTLSLFPEDRVEGLAPDAAIVRLRLSELNPPFPDGDKRPFGYSRDHRPQLRTVAIALVVTPDGLPNAYEVLASNISDIRTLRDFLARIERLYDKARRM